MLVALLLTGCARRRAVRRAEADGGAQAFAMRFVRESDLPPPKGRDPSPDPNDVFLARSRTWVASSASARRTHLSREEHEPALERTASEPLRPEASKMESPGPAGPPPDDAKNEGRPEARRPDSLTPLPTDRPGRYASPAPLKKQEKAEQSEGPPIAGTAPADGPVAVDAAAAVAAFPPQRTAALEDDVPESGVAEPTEIGSYHVQVSTSAAFGPILFDKIYPFMADIDLKADLAVKKVPHGDYWLRFALVDLLGFEHPFSRPTRIIVR